MLKYIFLATTITIATPAIAQDTKTAEQPAATQQSAPPASDDASTTPTQAAPASPDPAPATHTAQPTSEPSEGQPAQTAATPQSTTPATPAQQPAANQSQVAQVVSTEFKNYDKDANGGLNENEFSTWMAALRKASDPSFKDGPEAIKWSTQAFAQADTDKNKAVSQGELTTFLTPKTAS